MLTGTGVSQAFLQYLKAFEYQLENRESALEVNPLNAQDSALSRLASALELGELERVALILAVIGELHPLELRAFTSAFYPEGASFLPAGTVSIHMVVSLVGEDPLLFTADSVLFRLRVLRFMGASEVALRLRPLTVDADVVKFLLGDVGWPASLAAYAGEVPDVIGSPDLELTQALERHLQQASPVTAQLFGRDLSEQYDLALTALGTLGLAVIVLRLEAFVGAESALADLALLERESRIKGFAFILEAHFAGLDVSEEQWPAQKLEGLVANLVGHLHAPVVVLCDEPLQLGAQRPALLLEVPHLSRAQQRDLWAELLRLKSAQEPRLRELTDQFDLPGNRIVERAQAARLDLPARASDAVKLERAWEACRLSGRQRLGKLAERLTGQPVWDDLILPPEDLHVLEQIVLHVKHRTQVYEEWGMGHHQRGLGITALFSGPSGTGKTLASEVVAHALQLDLYRVDVSNMVSKYIGETEKNLKKIFDAADEGGVILLFDEADSLFGKRGDVQSSNDRFANTQVNYLLQRMESYRGLALLTTNLESGMDSAFMRRLRFTLNFRNPQAAERERIWRRAFPSQVDVSALNFQQLADVKLAGGNIRSIALNAAFLAASRAETLRMPLMREAIRGEWRKLGRLSLDEGAFAGWT